MPTVFGVALSPFVRKVRVALAEKQIPYDLVPVFGPQAPPDWKEMSPLGKIPAFKDGERTLCDSSIICTYLERTHPTPALYPKDAYEHARALWIEEFADTALIETIGQPIFFNMVVNPRFMGKEPDRARADKAFAESLPPRLEYLEAQLPASGHFVGDGLTIADIAVASPLTNLRHAGYDVDAKRYPKLAKHLDTMQARPSFATCIAEEKGFLGT
jgi:glutathione S-transferase